jgi:outer membrane protein assembly factor BamB
VDADTGALVWQSGPLAEGFQAAVAGGFTQWGFPVDRLLLGTRNSTGGNAFYALDPATGVPVGTTYTGAEGGGLGPVSGGASVDYDTNRVFFASRAAGPGAHTLWCLEVTAGGFVYRWSNGVAADVDGSPVVRGDRVYVGDSEGVVHAFDKLSGDLEWSFDTGNEAINGFLFPDRTGNGLYLATANRVIGLADEGTGASNLFPPRTVSSPSLVLFRPAEGGQPPRLYFGAGDQRLHELDLSQSPPTERTVVLGGTPAVIGAPSYDTTNGFIYVGSDAGILYGVEAPLPEP